MKSILLGLASAFKMELVNQLNSQYMIEVRVGSQQQTLIVDINSDLVALQSDICSNCVEGRFKTPRIDHHEVIEEVIGESHIEGYMIQERLCIEQTCLLEFDLMVIKA